MSSDRRLPGLCNAARHHELQRRARGLIGSRITSLTLSSPAAMIPRIPPAKYVEELLMAKRITVVFSLPIVFVLVFPSTWSSSQAQQASSQANPEIYSQLQFRYIGPVGNRATAVLGISRNPNIYYVGAASGGIFKTTDAGIHWDPIFDTQTVSSIGALAIAASDPNIVWAGTGESFIRSHISVGEGIFKSTDAGKTWTRMGLEKT